MRVAKFGLDDIPLQIVSPSVSDPTRAPAGHHTVKIEGTLPYGLKEGPRHWDNIKDQVAEKVFGTFAARGSQSDSGQGAREVPRKPARHRAHESRHVARQRAPRRPASFPSSRPYKMPIPGLYQTGACTAPGRIHHRNAG